MVDPKEIKIVRSNRRSIVMQLEPDGTILVKAPTLMPKFLINNFIKRNNGWIKKRIGAIRQNAPKTKKFISGELFTYLGNDYPLEVGNYTKVEIKNGKLLFPQALLFRAKVELQNWYIKQAKNFIAAQVEYYANEMSASYANITFSDTRSKWGSCTHDNRLQFNHRLIMAPLLVVRYVIIHELAHTF